MKVIRTTSKNQDFRELVKLLDAELAIRDGEDHAFYNQYNKIDMIKHAIVLYDNEKPIACGALKAFDEKAMEVKRMFTLKDNRGKNIASKVLSELENWATEMNLKDAF